MIGGTTGGTTVEKKNGDVLEAEGPEYNRAVLPPYPPSSWIEEISVEVKKKGA
jgi:hypothetical protein